MKNCNPLDSIEFNLQEPFKIIPHIYILPHYTTCSIESHKSTQPVSIITKTIWSFWSCYRWRFIAKLLLAKIWKFMAQCMCILHTFSCLLSMFPSLQTWQMLAILQNPRDCLARGYNLWNLKIEEKILAETFSRIFFRFSRVFALFVRSIDSWNRWRWFYEQSIE